MKEPPHGLCYPCSLERVIDGDTVVVRVSGYEVHIRLLECWAPEVHGEQKERGLVSKASLVGLVAASSRFCVFVPASHGSLLEVITMGRVLGRVFADGVDMSEHQVSGGCATKDKVAK